MAVELDRRADGGALMAYAKVDEIFWHDPVIRALSERARMLYLYLLTSPHRNRFGCYVLDPWYASADLQWDRPTVTGALQELQDADRIAWDETHRVVFLKRYLRHNTLENHKVVKGALGDLRSLPSTPLLHDLLAAMEENKRAHYLPLLEALRNRLANGIPNRRDLPLPLPSPSPSPLPTTTPAPPPARAGEPEPVFAVPDDEPPGPLRDLILTRPEAVACLARMRHPGGVEGTLAMLRQSFLYADPGRGAAPDPSVSGRSPPQRVDLVARALGEMRSAGKRDWSSAALAGFIRGLERRNGIGAGAGRPAGGTRAAAGSGIAGKREAGHDFGPDG